MIDFFIIPPAWILTAVFLSHQSHFKNLARKEKRRKPIGNVSILCLCLPRGTRPWLLHPICPLESLRVGMVLLEEQVPMYPSEDLFQTPLLVIKHIHWLSALLPSPKIMFKKKSSVNTVLVSHSCWNKLPQISWLKTTEIYYVSYFWRSEVRNGSH